MVKLRLGKIKSSTQTSTAPKRHCYWGLELQCDTMSCNKENNWESRPGRCKNPAGDNPHSEHFFSCLLVCQVHKKCHQLSIQGASPAANLAFNFNSTSIVLNNYLLWVFLFSVCTLMFTWNLHISKGSTVNQSQTKHKTKVSESRKFWEAEVWASELHLLGTWAVFARQH